MQKIQTLLSFLPPKNGTAMELLLLLFLLFLFPLLSPLSSARPKELLLDCLFFSGVLLTFVDKYGEELVNCWADNFLLSLSLLLLLLYGMTGIPSSSRATKVGIELVLQSLRDRYLPGVDNMLVILKHFYLLLSSQNAVSLICCALNA